jgi:hypothetical protein
VGYCFARRIYANARKELPQAKTEADDPRHIEPNKWSRLDEEGGGSTHVCVDLLASARLSAVILAGDLTRVQSSRCRGILPLDSTPIQAPLTRSTLVPYFSRMKAASAFADVEPRLCLQGRHSNRGSVRRHETSSPGLVIINFSYTQYEKYSAGIDQA